MDWIIVTKPCCPIHWDWMEYPAVHATSNRCKTWAKDIQEILPLTLTGYSLGNIRIHLKVPCKSMLDLNQLSPIIFTAAAFVQVVIRLSRKRWMKMEPLPEIILLNRQLTMNGLI